MSIKDSYALRGLLVVMVFLQHFIFTADIGLYSDPLILLSTIARGDYAVAMLFTLSGYVLYKSWGGKTVDSYDLARRLIRLILPMFAVFMIIYALHAASMGAYSVVLSNLGFNVGLVEPIGSRIFVTFSDIFLSFLKQVFLGQNENYVLVAWVLPFELFFSILFFGITVLSRKIKRLQTLFIFVFAVLLAAFDIYTAAFKGLAGAFCFGVVVSMLESKRGVSVYSPVWMAVSIIALLQGQKIATSGHDWLPTLINQGFEGYVFSVLEADYFFYGLMFSLYAFTCSFLIKGRLVKLLFGWLEWVGVRGYSFHLMGQVSIVLSATLLKIYSYGDSGNLVAGNKLLLLLVELVLVFALVQIFYSLVEKRSHVTKERLICLTAPLMAWIKSRWSRSVSKKPSVIIIDKGES